MQRTVPEAVWTAILVLTLATTVVAQPNGDGPEFGSYGVGGSALPSRDAADAPRSNPRNRGLDELGADITVPPDETVPEDQSSRLFSRGMVASAAEAWHEPACLFAWAPTDLCYWPLYFEDVQLERYGQTLAPRFQGAFSGARFVADFALVPLKMVFDPPLSCVCTLGYHRPGSRVPCRQRHVLPMRQPHVTAPQPPSAEESSTELARLPAAGSL